MEGLEEEIVEVVDRGLVVVVEERIVVEDRVVYKVLKGDTMIVAVDMKVAASMFDVMVAY